MEIVPVRREYNFSIMNHTIRVCAEHLKVNRLITFQFDDKMVSEKVVTEDGILTDDDCIMEMVDSYGKNNVGVYADIIKRHADKVLLVSKHTEVDIMNNGISLNVKIKVEKDHYTFQLATGDDEFVGRFKSDSVSEALEKMRLFANTLEGTIFELAKNISALSDDKIEKTVEWK